MPFDEPEPISWETLKHQCADDDELVQEVLNVFRREWPSLLADVGHAVAKKDPDAVRRAAHRLKGALLGLAATPTAEVAQRLENSAASGDVADAQASYQELATQVERLVAAIR